MYPLVGTDTSVLLAYRTTVIGTSYELSEAPAERPYDYTISPTTFDDDVDPDNQIYNVWEIEDRKFEVAVDDDAPTAAFDAVEREGLSPRWATEVQRERIKRVTTEIVERPAYYVEEEPEHRFVSIGRNRTLELLAERGLEGQYEDAWYYPERDELVALINYCDDAGEARRMTWRCSSLTDAERSLVLDGDSLESEESERSVSDLGDLIYRSSRRIPRGLTPGLNPTTRVPNN